MFWLKGISRFWLFQWRLSGVSQKLAQLVYDRFCRLRCRRIWRRRWWRAVEIS